MKYQRFQYKLNENENKVQINYKCVSNTNIFEFVKYQNQLNKNLTLLK